LLQRPQRGVLDLLRKAVILLLNISTATPGSTRSVGMRKSKTGSVDADRSGLTRLEEIPNVGPAVAADLRLLGLTVPQDLIGRDPYTLYEDLCRVTQQRHDPCLLDTFIAAVRFMDGESARPWWAYTAERKRELEVREKGSRGKRGLFAADRPFAGDAGGS
jgi:hypothetical protein